MKKKTILSMACAAGPRGGSGAPPPYLALRDRLLTQLRTAIPKLRVHGEGAPIAGHVVSVGIPGIASEMLMISLDMEGLAVSGGSACQSGSTRVSHVLAAMYGDDALPAAIRFSFGRDTSDEEIDRAAAATLRVVKRLRASAVVA